jgi:hypothetical protein
MNVSNLLLLLNIISTLAIVGTFLVYWRQLLAMRGQLEASRTASESQNILHVINFIQQPHVRNARQILIGLKNKPLANWTDEDRAAADIACGSYDIVGILAKLKVVPVNILVETWGDSIRKCHIAALPLIEEYQKPENRGTTFWDDFDWLDKEVNKIISVDTPPPDKLFEPTES